MTGAATVLAHAGPHGDGGHGTDALAFIAIAVLVGGWIAVGVAAWLFLRARVDSPEPPDTRAAAHAQAPAREDDVQRDPESPPGPPGEPQPPPAYG